MQTGMNSWRSKIELQAYSSINLDWSHISVKYGQTSKYRGGEGKRGEWREPGEERERERESNTPEFSCLLCQQVQLTSNTLVWISRRENAYRQKYQLSYANSRLKPLQLVEVQEVYCWLCFTDFTFVCLFIRIPSLLVNCTCLCERTQLQDFELMVSLSVPYLCASQKIADLTCWRARLWSGR